MIQGSVIKQRDTIIKPYVFYRDIKALNCSMIKLFDSNPVKFYEAFKLGKKKDEAKSVALIIGDIVDFYILDCKGSESEFDNKFDEKFSLYKGDDVKGQVKVLADELYKITMRYTVDNKVTVDFDVLFDEAIQEVKNQGKYTNKDKDVILEDFNKKGLTYYKKLREDTNKTVLDHSLLEKGKSVAKNILHDPFTADIFHETEHIEYFTKFPIEWKYTCKSGNVYDCKSELDMLVIDHEKKIIYPKDLKTTYDNENFESNYLRMRYDLQAAFYHIALKYWVQEEGMTDYSILPMEFIVGDTSINNRRPIRYRLGVIDLQKAMAGYTIENYKYNGIISLIEAIDWAESTGNWNVSMSVYNNKGIIPLSLNYE